MLGHRNLRTTQIYAKVVERKVGEDMDRLEERLSSAAGSASATKKFSA